MDSFKTTLLYLEEMGNREGEKLVGREAKR